MDSKEHDWLELQTPEHRSLRRSVHQQQFYLTI
jgi:hypothetical protein